MLNEITIKKEKQWIQRSSISHSDEAVIADISASLGINPIIAKCFMVLALVEVKK